MNIPPVPLMVRLRLRPLRLLRFLRPATMRVCALTLPRRFVCLRPFSGDGPRLRDLTTFFAFRFVVRRFCAVFRLVFFFAIRSFRFGAG